MKKSKEKTGNGVSNPVVPQEKWFKLGEEGLKEKEKQDMLAQIRKEKAVGRFWLKAGEEANIVFVDDVGFYVKTHQLQIDGSWSNFITCIRDFAPCPICNSGKKSTTTCYYTVIDTREIILKDGTKSKNRKVLFPAKGSAINILADMKKKYGSLVGLAFKVKRYSDQSPNCGDFFELISKKRVDLTKFGADANKPIDYIKVLAPPTEDELKSLGFGVTILGEEVEEQITDDKLSNIFGE